MNFAMSSSKKESVSFVIVPTVSDQALADAVPAATRPWTTNPSGTSRTRMSRMPRLSRNAPIDRKTSSKSCLGLPS